MKLSLNWLNDHVCVKDMSAKEIANILTKSGSCAEKIEKDCPNINGIVVGKILSIEKHRDAEKLLVCKVDVKKDRPIQIVTGAQNIVLNALVPVCLKNATIYDGTVIKPQKLRGISSEGMMCSISELGLTKEAFPYADENGIFLIEEECEVGQDIKTALGLTDEIIDFEITSNRPDCLSIFGLALELCAAASLPINKLKKYNFENNSKKQSNIKIKIESNFCKRYMATLVENVKVCPSPVWLRNRLRVCGIKPINNVVDITNYVMMEYGVPMHAYDADKIDDMNIVVRNAKNGEKIKALDHKDYLLDENCLLVCNNEKPISVAGIIGGEESSVKESTQNVIFEVGCFEGFNIRQTSKNLKIKTEASLRFEKNLNPNWCDIAIKRACELILSFNIGEINYNIVDCKNYKDSDYLNSLELDYNFVNKLLGTKISQGEMKEILKRLHFKVNGTTIYIPSFRIDIKNKADIAEEIARIYGYDKIPSELPKSFSKDIGLSLNQKFKNNLKNCLTGLGLNEIYTFSFISPKLYAKMAIDIDYVKNNSIRILNPFGEETSLMRLTLAPSIVGVMEKNFKNKNEEGYFFEIGKAYNKKDEQIIEEEVVCIGIYGKECSFFELKGILQSLFSYLKIENCSYTESKSSYFHPYVCCKIYRDNLYIGEFGKLNPIVCENFKITKNSFVANLNYDAIFDASTKEVKYSKISKFPAVKRDLCLVCDEEISCGFIEKEIKSNIGDILENLEVFDVYRGENLGEHKKSISFNIVMRNKEKTLTEEEIELKIQNVLTKLELKGIFLRKL